MRKGTGKFIVGAGLGAAVALLFTTEKGAEIRENISNKAKELIDKAKNIDSKEVKANIEKKVKEIKAELADLDKEKVKKIANEKGLDSSLLNLIDYSTASAEDVKSKIEDIETAFNKAVEKALKKVPFKAYKQNGVKCYWNPEELPDTYQVYRVDVNLDDKRSPEEIPQQELKNAICITLRRKGPLDKDALAKETVKTMGYSRSGKALLEAVERGLKFGRKTGEIRVNADKKFEA